MIASPSTPCGCTACQCVNAADLTLNDETHVCGCCLADCPDVHGGDGLTWRTGYQVRAVPWEHGWELHVDQIGVTQCTAQEDAEQQVRDLLECMEISDARTARISVWYPADPLPDEIRRALEQEAE